MHRRILWAITLLLVVFTLGALLGRRWRGSFADTILTIVAIFALALVLVVCLNSLRSRMSLSGGRHLVLERGPEEWKIRLQDWWRIESVELRIVFRLGWSAKFRPVPSHFSLRTQIANHRWRLLALATACLLIAFTLQQLSVLAGDQDHAPVIVAWVLAIGLYAFAVVPGRPLVQLDWRAWWYANGRVALVVAALTLAALVLRVWQLGEIPFALSGDEATFGQEAIKVVQGTVRNPFTLGLLTRPTMSFFYDSLSVRLFGASPAAIRLPWAILGTLTIPVSFWLVSRMKGVTLGLTTAALLAVYHFHIHYSRLNLDNIGDPLWGGLALLFFYRAITGRHRLDWLILGVINGWTLYAYTGARLIPILTLGLIGYYLLKERRRFWCEQRVGLLVALGAFLLVAAPMLESAYRFPVDFNGRIDEVSILAGGRLQEIAASRGQSVATFLLDQFRRSALAFNYYPDTWNFYGLPQPLLDPIFGVLFLLGLGYATLRVVLPRTDPALVPMVAWSWGGIILGGMLTQGPPASMRLVTLTLPVCFLIALAMERLIDLAQQAIGRVPKRAVLTVGTLAFAVISLNTYFVDYAPLHISGGNAAELATQLAIMLKKTNRPYQVYFFGAPDIFWNFPNFTFLLPDADAMDVVEPIESVPAEWLSAKGEAIFVFLPRRNGEIPLIQRTFPNGETTVLQSAQYRQVLATVYEVSR